METFSGVLALAVILGFVGFGMWLRQQRRLMIHRERLAAIEKGIELPPVLQEVQRTSWNVQRLLLLAGLVWISIGTGFYLVFSEMLRHPTEFTQGRSARDSIRGIRADRCGRVTPDRLCRRIPQGLVGLVAPKRASAKADYSTTFVTK